MRTIKFRAKNLDGEWVYGFYVEEERQTLNGFEKKYFIVNDGYDYVKPDTVGQFTGLYDKDGKEIYEGDIMVVCYNYSGLSFKGIATYKIARFIIKQINGDGYTLFSDYGKEQLEVIGNIHDNPELLKGGNHGSK